MAPVLSRPLQPIYISILQLNLYDFILQKKLILNRKNATSQDFVKMAFMCQFLAFHEKSQRKESKFPFFDQRASSCLSSRIHTDLEFSAYDVNIVSLFQLKCYVVIKEFKVLLKFTTLRPKVY